MSARDREKWDQRYRERGAYAAEPSAFLRSMGDRLPSRGRAIDVAGGAGRHAIWLAQRGLTVTLADVSTVGLELAAGAAAAAGVTLDLRPVDLESDPFPAGPWDLIVSFHFLRRGLFPAFLRELAPGGWLCFCQQTVTNLERHAKPPREFLLADGELPGLARGFDVVSYEEGWTDEGRHEARLLARRPVG